MATYHSEPYAFGCRSWNSFAFHAQILALMGSSALNTSEMSVLVLFALSVSEIIMLVWLSLAGALGQMCIFYTIANFGALTCSLITTLRKMMQIGLSALAFGHTFTALQLVGVASSFTGVFLNMNDKRRKKTPSQVGAETRLKHGVKQPNYDDNFLAATRSSV